MASADILSPPFVTIAGIANFRDVGGHSTLDGQTITTGLTFRCADPSKATAEGLDKMSQDLGKVKHHHPYHPKRSLRVFRKFTRLIPFKA